MFRVRHAHRVIGAVAAAFALAAASQVPADAGQFMFEGFGGTTSNDIAPVVSSQFTTEYPVTKYALVVISGSMRLGSGVPACYAVAGVQTRAHELGVPLDRFGVTTVGNHPMSTRRWIHERHAFEATCAREAVSDLMEAVAQGKRVYYPVH